MAVERTGKYGEAPMLAELVRAGELPPVDKRLPKEPAVVEPINEIGQYGGTWRHVTQSPTSSWIQRRTGYEPFVRYARDARSIAPNIAKDWDVVDDGKSYIFYLREGMKWSDGDPFDAEDVMFWYESELLNEDLTPSFPKWLTTDGDPVVIEKIDDYTVKFSFSQQYGVLLDWMAQYATLIPPKHYLAQFHPDYADAEKVEKLAKDAGFELWFQYYQDRNSIALNTELPTNKPWMLINPTQENVSLERNPYYWKVDTEGNQLPYIDKRFVDLVPEPEMINMRTMAGEYTAQIEFLAPANYTMFMENREQGGYRVYKWTRGESGFALFPAQTYDEDPFLAGLLRDQRFRRALSLAIDRDEIQELVYLGLAQGVETVLFSQSMWDSPTATRIINENYSHKPDVANRLLDELGLTERSSDGFRLRPDGKELSLLIEIPQSWPELIDAGTLVQEYLDDVGIKTTAKTQDDSLVVKRTQSNDVQVVGYLLTYIGWISDPRDYVPVAAWGCYWGNQYAQWYNSGGEQGMEPPAEIMKIIDLYGEISMTLDMNERARLEEELFQHYAEQVIGIPVVGLIPNLAVVKDSFQNLPEMAFNSWPLRYPGYLNPEQFYIRQ